MNDATTPVQAQGKGLAASPGALAGLRLKRAVGEL